MSWSRFRQLDFPHQYQPVIGELCVINEANGLRGNIITVPDATPDGTIREYSRCWDEVHPGPPYLDGGGFFVSKLKKPTQVIGGGSFRSKPLTTGIPASVKRKPGDICRRMYTGAFSLGGVTHGFSSHGSLLEGLSPPEIENELNPDDLTNLGNRAYVKLRPKIEDVSLAQTIAELGSVQGMLKTTSKGLSEIWSGLGGNIHKEMMAPKSVANHFLNHHFGWKPLVSDVQGTLNCILNFDDYLDHVRERNDRWLVRKYTEDAIQSEEVVYRGNVHTNSCSPSLSPSEFLVPNSCFQTVTRRKLTRVWYKGVFKYYRPEFDYMKKMHPVMRRLRQQITALGLNINPTVIYKVMPWTWCLDWFVNVGDYVTRVQDMASDSIMSKSFYLMRHNYVVYEYRKVFTFYDGQTCDLRWYRTVETKRRGKADSPFHFTSPPGGLSQMQMALLAAVGLSYT